MPRNIRAEIDQVLARIAQSPADRHVHQPELHLLIVEAQAAGLPLPEGLGALEAKLIDEAVEAQFDNFPV